MNNQLPQPLFHCARHLNPEPGDFIGSITSSSALAEGQNRSLAAGSATFHQPRKPEARLRPENIVIAPNAVRRNSRERSPKTPRKGPDVDHYFTTFEYEPTTAFTIE
jgi:hypothetical protein